MTSRENVAEIWEISLNRKEIQVGKYFSYIPKTSPDSMSGFEPFEYGVQIYGYPEGTQWDVVATKWTSHTLRSFVQVLSSPGVPKKTNGYLQIREKLQIPKTPFHLVFFLSRWFVSLMLIRSCQEM